MSADRREVGAFYQGLLDRNIQYTQARIKRAERFLASPLIRDPKTRAKWRRILETEQVMLTRYVVEKLKQ